MLFLPRQTGNTTIPKDKLEEDKLGCLKIGPCGIGERAIYLNSFFLDRVFYVDIRDVRRIFKRVAMSKNGFSGRGMFGSMAYLVVLLSDGTERQCNFKDERDVDRFISEFHARHPEIPLVSENAEKRLSTAKAQQESRYLKTLSPRASASIDELDDAIDFLEVEPELYKELSDAAKQKRIIDNIKPGYRILAVVILLISIMACVYGVYGLITVAGTAIYFLLFGGAFIFYALGLNVLPSRNNSKAAAKKRFEDAVAECERYIGTYKSALSFPVPARYAHPSVLKRMKRIIREGRAQDIKEAYSLMKEELKAINNSVRVSQEEYDEIVAIKPIFLVCGYADK